MKPIFDVKDSQRISESFSVRYLDVPHSSNQYHYHEEFEILYNIENRGVRCIGDSIERYSKNDLVFIGHKIPHFWHSDSEYFSKQSEFKTRAVIVKFHIGVFADTINNFPELANLADLFIRSGRGVNFRGIDAHLIGMKLVQLCNLKGWRAILMLIEILSMMNESENFRLLSSTSFYESHKNGHEEKINKIFNLMVENHKKELTLEEAASHVNMSVSAFCRYFKKHTTKTYSQLLNEIRIGFACKSLIYTEDTISEIAFNSGYKNVPYFNRLFKKLKEVTPNEYRQKHLKILA